MMKWLRRIAWGLLGFAAILLLFLSTLGPGLTMSLLNRARAGGPYQVSDAAKALHAKLWVMDMHSDSLMWGRDILKRDTRGHVDVPRLIEGNVALQGFTAPTRIPASMNINATPDKWDVQVPLAFFQMWPAATWYSAKERAVYQAHRFAKAAEQSGGKLTFIRTREDVDRYADRRRREENITAGFLGIEGLHCLEGDLNNVRMLFHEGFRMMGPTHFFDNPLGGSAHGLSKMGLTEFGAAVIESMEKLHILVDLAHASPKMVDDILARATRPVVVSHTGVKGTCDNNRNLSDDHVKRIAKNGGVIGIGFWDTAVCGKDVDSIVKAIQYTAALAGVDHVGLGSDYDGATWTPFDASGMALLTEGLMKAGFKEDEIAKIMGGNMLRLLHDALPSENDKVPDIMVEKKG